MVLAVCPHPGCPTLTESGACPAHQVARPQDMRLTAKQRGYDSRWTAYSRQYREANPYCKTCLEAKRTTRAELVDHIKPVTNASDPLFWEPTNHQSLCRPCHAVKTAKEGKTQHEPKAERFWFA